MKKVFIVLLFFAVAIAYTYQLLKPEQKLNVFLPRDINHNLVDVKVKNKKSHTVGSFSLINQFGDTITENLIKDKIFVVDFFFTTCPTICPIMTEEMTRVYQTFKEKDDFLILSHSVTPLIDQPGVLLQYAKDKNVLSEKWQFLTGSKKEIYRLARQVYFTSLDEGDGGVQDFIHTENFVLIDKKGQLRGFYDGTNEQDVSRLIKEIKILYKEYQ